MGIGPAGGSDDGDGPILGINVTPLVDVTLVLLIVFLVTAKMISMQGIPLDVPRVATSSLVEATIAVTIEPTGAMTVDGQPIANGEALTQLANEVRVRASDVRAVIRAPVSASHGSVVAAMDALRLAKVTRIALAVEKKTP